VQYMPRHIFIGTFTYFAAAFTCVLGIQVIEANLISSEIVAQSLCPWTLIAIQQGSLRLDQHPSMAMRCTCPFVVPSGSPLAILKSTERHRFLGLLSLQDKNSALGCGYDITLTSPDYDPAEHYWNLYAGCRLSNGLGVVIILTCLLATYAVMDIDMEKRRSQAEEGMERPLI